MSRDLKQVTATGDVVTGSARLLSASLAGGSAASTVDIRDGSGGAVRLTLKAAIGDTVSWTAGDSDGVLFSSTVHATLTGAGAAASFEYA